VRRGTTPQLTTLRPGAVAAPGPGAVAAPGPRVTTLHPGAVAAPGPRVSGRSRRASLGCFSNGGLVRGLEAWLPRLGLAGLRSSIPRVILTALALFPRAGVGVEVEEAARSEASSRLAVDPVFEEAPIFVSGEGGYHTYRIPALVVTRRGTVLAFCEARKSSRADHGDVDLALRRSIDGGRTWDAMRIVADDGNRTIGNPCPVVDRRTGAIWLPYCRDNRLVLISKSIDDGATWSDPVEIPREIVSPAGHWVGTGPGHGIQVASGRLIIPCWADATANLGEVQTSFVIHSDDGGTSWRRGGALERDASDEAALIERADGSLYLNARSRRDKRLRAVAISRDGGENWSPVRYDPNLPEPSCQGSLVRYSAAGSHDRNRILFAGPASPSDRTRMTVRLSYDDGETWPVSRVIEAGAAAYSDLAVTLERFVLLAYEADEYRQIQLARFDIPWLSQGLDIPIEPLRYSLEVRTAPRPLRIHFVWIDLAYPGHELAVSVGEDPDGAGPIEATLTPPQRLAESARFHASINTNPWKMLPAPEPGLGPRYVEGATADISGWVETAAGTRSPAEKGHWSFWVDESGRGRIADIDRAVKARVAVAGFRGLIRAGEILPAPSEVRHPRTALGLDRDGRLLTLLVIDGRQPGYSEGVSELELAEILAGAGCHDALNLDGGGSSVLLLGESAGSVTVMNRPSDIRGPRPIPVQLGLRRKE
jgi:sialidase-1